MAQRKNKRRILTLAEKARLPKKKLKAYRKWLLKQPKIKPKEFIITPNGKKIEKSKYERYRKYLSTEAWRKKREMAFAFHGRTCRDCGADNLTLDIHHITYERLFDEKMDDLVPLCRKCHEQYHSPKNRVRKALPSQLADAGTRSQYV